MNAAVVPCRRSMTLSPDGGMCCFMEIIHLAVLN